MTLKDILSCFPYDDVLTRFEITGDKLKKVFSYIMRPENRNSEGECYQVNGRVHAEYDDGIRGLVSFNIDDTPVSDQESYTLCLQGFHVSNSDKYLNISNQELLESGNTRVVSTSAKEVLEEYLRNHQNIVRKIEGRLIYQTSLS